MTVHASGGEVKVYSRPDWDALGIHAEPLLSLTRDEGLVLERFLSYWLEGDRPDHGPLYKREGVDVEFDF